MNRQLVFTPLVATNTRVVALELGVGSHRMNRLAANVQSCTRQQAPAWSK